MKRTVLNLTSDLPVYSAQRRQWIREMERLHQAESDRAIDMLGGLLILLGVVVTAVLLTLWAKGWL